MTFIGGETDIEPDIRKIHHLRHDLPEIGHGEVNYDAVQTTDRGIYAVARSSESNVSLLLVNLTRNDITTNVDVGITALAIDPDSTYSVTDNWTGNVLDHCGSYSWSAESLASFDMTFAPYQVRVLTLRRG